MLQKFAQLGTEIEGRYATNLELEDLDKYIASIDYRISAYEKISQRAEEIIDQVIEEAIFKHNLMENNQTSLKSQCKYDMGCVLRACTASMLINDLDRLREGFLLWFQTIVIALKLTRYAQVKYQILKEMIKALLTPEEIKVMLPSLQLSQTLLGG